ncbi:MAG: RNA methyltransferase [Gammaproteobacteria bacterium]
MPLPVRIVLVETSHPGNIGASARAMKTMGMDDLVLVAPKQFPCADATARASGADDVLARARVVASLSEAIEDCGFVVGASARLRSLSWPTVDPRTCARTVCEQAADSSVALVLGPEHSGLTNEDLGRCHQLVHIPANPEYSSLNLAMAVQVLCYELRMAQDEASGVADAAEKEAREAPLATADELDGFHRQMEAMLADVGFLKPDHPRQLKLRLRRIFHRSRLDQTEINILRGMLAALDPRARREHGKQK